MKKMLISELIKMPIFPYADVFPHLPEEEMKELAQDLECQGQHHPIIIYNDMILDGRNRVRAFQGTNIQEAVVEYFEGTEFQAVEMVRALNILRRHLTVGQRALAALAYLPYEEAEAKNRQLEALKRGRETQQTENLIPPDLAGSETKKHSGNQARNIVAEKFNLSGQRISEAKNLALNAPDLSEEVKVGTKSLDKATRELKARKEERETKISALESQTFDLYSQYQNHQISLDDAYALLIIRQAQKKREAQTRSEALYLIQGFVNYAETHLQEFNLKIVKITEVGFVDEALNHLSDIEGYLAVTKNALNVAKIQLQEDL